MKITNSKKIILIMCGIFAGFINGLMGSGGGVVTVALLLGVLQLSQKYAQATALTIILPLTVVSAVVYLINGNVEWNLVWQVTIGVVGGGVVGALLLNKLNGNVTKLIFAVLLVAGGVKMFL